MAWPLPKEVSILFPSPSCPCDYSQAPGQGHTSLPLSFREKKASSGPLGSWDLQDARYVQKVGQRLLVPLAFLLPDCLCYPGLAWASVSPSEKWGFPLSSLSQGHCLLQGPKGNKGSQGNMVSGWAGGWATGMREGRFPGM